MRAEPPAGIPRYSRVAALTIAAIALALPIVTSCRGRSQKPDASAGETESAPPAAAPADDASGTDIVLLFPGTNDDLLHPQKRHVVPIDSVEERAKQCLEELFRGPDPGLLAAVPAGVQIRDIYILPDGTAYADLSQELTAGPGGSERELLTVYAIVDTVILNLRSIKRVGILVNGEARETLAGHVYIGRPLAADFDYVEPAARPAPLPPSSPPDAAGGDGSAGGARAAPGEGSATGGHGSEPEKGSEPGEGSGTGTSGTSGDTAKHRGASGESTPDRAAIDPNASGTSGGDVANLHGDPGCESVSQGLVWKPFAPRSARSEFA